MQFRSIDPRRYPNSNSRDGVYLEANTWDDYGFKTLWTLHCVFNGDVTTIGTVKIGDFAQNSRPPVPDSFTGLPDQFFSLGQDEDYYDRLNSLGPARRLEILRSLRDISLDLNLFRQVENLEVTRTSLLRSVTPVAVRTQFHRIAMGGVKLSPYSFFYDSPDFDRHGADTESFRFDFDVRPQSNPRSNVHVLIGRNGVGKSFMLNDIAIALTRGADAAGSIDFKRSNDERLTNRFANVVSVAYSAFDAFEPRRQSSSNDAMRHHYVGLKKIAPSSEKPGGVKSHIALAQEFGSSLKKLVDMRRLERWRRTIEFLNSDPLFAESINRMLDVDEPTSFRAEARDVFSQLSSGHKIVLLILTRLVQTVEEATLVLIDEPESHLHPPLLSAFMTALSELLEDRNGVAIIATHSPVVLQEVPSNCVWNLLGTGGVLTAQRPFIETYGENVGTITQEIFGLEVTDSGFHKALADAAQRGGSFARIVNSFEGKLGAEARALLQSMVYFTNR